MTASPALRIDVDSDDVARGFAQLVLTLAELVRELLERQAIRRMDAGDLTDAQVERLGTALLRIRDELEELRQTVARPRTDNIEGNLR
jgi:Gas vesicle protein K